MNVSVAAARAHVVPMSNQPGHPGNPISDKGGRFNTDPEVEFADPNHPKDITTKKPLRSLDEL
jgi:hypothetical protein